MRSRVLWVAILCCASVALALPVITYAIDGLSSAANVAELISIPLATITLLLTVWAELARREIIKLYPERHTEHPPSVTEHVSQRPMPDDVVLVNGGNTWRQLDVVNSGSIYHIYLDVSRMPDPILTVDGTPISKAEKMVPGTFWEQDFYYDYEFSVDSRPIRPTLFRSGYSKPILLIAIRVRRSHIPRRIKGFRMMVNGRVVYIEGSL